MCSVSGNNKRFNELNCSEVVNTYNNYTFYDYQYEHNYGNYSSQNKHPKRGIFIFVFKLFSLGWMQDISGGHGGGE